MTDAEIERVAKGLTEAGREVLVTGTGTNWMIPLHLSELGLVDEGFAYTPLGLAVRSYLQREQAK